jgi:Transposase DDE domain
MSSKKVSYRVTNWPEYNRSLKQRGSLTIWLSDDFEKSWLAGKEATQSRGRPFVYSDTSMRLMLTLRQVFKLALRQLTGFVESLFTLIGKVLPIPEFSRLSKRMSRSLSRLRLPSLEKVSHLVIDSTGLKVFGEKEWLETKHGKQYQRKIWRKLHIGIEGQGLIVAREMTAHCTDDRACVNPLLDQADTNFIGEVLADSGYDSHKIYRDLAIHQIRPIIPPPINAVVSSEIHPSMRDQTIAYIEKKGYWAWYYKNNFGRRSKVENTFYRIKTIFGRKLLSRSWNNQNAETQLMCCLLNKMTQLGMPQTVKTI